MTGDVPPSMSGACSCSLDGHMYIFGGCDDNGQTNMVRLMLCLINVKGCCTVVGTLTHYCIDNMAL